MIFILLMSFSLISVGIGILMIIIGLFFGALVFLICLSAVSSLSTTIENTLFSEVDTVIQNIGCALASGVCCYSGLPCCCTGNGPTCQNQPFPP
jgi:hypothetical protein